jgi:anti-anti-sigma factor
MRTGFDQANGSERWGLGEPGGAIRLSCRELRGGGATVAIRGELDLATADWTVRSVTDLIDRRHGLVSVDLGGLAFCDASGLAALLRIAAHAERSGRRIEFTRPSRSLVKIMRITGVDGRLLTAALAG